MEINNDFFSVKRENDILFLEMNGPGNNLMTGDFLDNFEDVMGKVEELSADETIKGLVISGGGRHFSVGADVGSLVDRTTGEAVEEDVIPDSHKKQKHAFTMLGSLPFPVISAVKGFCIGSGCEIAANSHIRICEPTSRLGQPESTFGILPALGGIARSAQICGLAEAAEMVLSGELFTADEGYKKGWADILCDKKQSTNTAVELINFIAESNIPYTPEKAAEFVCMFKESRNIIG